MNEQQNELERLRQEAAPKSSQERGKLIRVGAAADFLILDPDAVPLVPGFNRTSDLVYAADPSCLDTVVCAGRVLMEGGVVPGEEEIVAAARQAARLLV